MARPPGPNAGTTYNMGDSGPRDVDQRRVVDTSYLELVRLGVKPPNDPNIVQTLSSGLDGVARLQKVGSRWNAKRHLLAPLQLRRLRRDSAMGRRGTSASPRAASATCTRAAEHDRATWPIFAGERGEYLLAADSRVPKGASAHSENRERRLHAARAGMG